ncbi:hypothetical protein ACU63Y_20835 [Klebsiella aerogenes]
MFNKSARLFIVCISLIVTLSGCQSAPPKRQSILDLKVPNTTYAALPYEVVLSATNNDHMMCHNCGNSGKSVLISGGEKLTQYNMMLESPYYNFLCTMNTGGCRKGNWIAFNKNMVYPHVKNIDIGGDTLIEDLRPINNKFKTWLYVAYASGEYKIFEFDNNQ